MTQLYVCEDCGRVGPLPEGFSDDCRPGWTHGRLIKITSDPERDRLREALQQTVDLCNAMREYAPTLNLAAEKQLRESLGLLDA